MKLVNTTPHTIRLLKPDGEILEIPPSGLVVRVDASTEHVGAVEGVPMIRTRFGAIQGLPAPAPDTLYITSTIVAQAAASAGRADVAAPDTGPQSVIRGPDGQIQAVRRLQVF